ncbi:uncharacterized protein [Euwallacea fornicatus]|uniref:uncharacterized protein n=1 Tax=Euwallacea fornicatus TaxID=995702 RepID=UPI00338F5FBE
MVKAVNLLCGFLVSAITLLIAKILDTNPKPIFGIYQRRNGVYWLKVWFLYGLLSMRKVRHWLSPKSEEYYKTLDNIQTLAPTPKAVDAVFFNGANKNGDHFIVGTARRPNRLIDGILYVKIKNSKFGILELPKIPDTTLFNTEEEEGYGAEGLKVSVVEPMKKWQITFSGQLKEHYKPEISHNVTIEASFSSDEPWFNYETDMHPWNMAKVLAYEKWSRSYFVNLKEAHQLHYEQFGLVKAKIVVDEEEFNIDFVTMRDHSISPNREWDSFRRYTIHWVSAENGDHFSVGTICQPVAYSRMQIGYVYKARERKMYPVIDSDLHLYQYGENGDFPKDYAFTFRAGNTDYVMQVNITDSPYFYISKEWEGKVNECFCTIEVNGVKGYGGVEWEYRNVDGRNVNHA